VKIVAILGVKDEIELIPRAISHLRAMGVDLIIACDDDSRDGTAEYLQSCRSKGDLEIVSLTEWGPTTPAEWSGHYLELVRRSGGDWVIFLDADEFWIPAKGTLRDYIRSVDSDVISAARFNVVLGRDGARLPSSLMTSLPELLLFVEPIPDFASYLARNPLASWIQGVPIPKVMARCSRVGRVAVGGHDVEANDQIALKKRRPTDLLIAHVPFTTRERFARKVENIRLAVGRDPDMFRGQMGWHWRRWLALADEGRLDMEFDRTSFDDSAIEKLRASGIIRTAQEVFENPGVTLKPHPVPPS